MPDEVKEKVAKVGKRAQPEVVRKAILELCEWKPLMPQEIASYLRRKSVNQLVEGYISPLFEEGLLLRTIPETPRHPGRKYKTSPEGIQRLLME